MIASTQIPNADIFEFIVVLVSNLLSRKVLFMTETTIGTFNECLLFKEIANSMGK